MSVEYDTTPVVDAVDRMSFSGNVIHRAWLMRPELRRDDGKINPVALMLLADCVYWYRPAKVVDEATHQLTKVHKRFKADMWHIDYGAWGAAFGFTERQVRDAASFLVQRGVLRREVRNAPVQTEGGKKITLPSRVYLAPVPEMLKQLHTPLDHPDERLTFKREPAPSRLNVSATHVQTGVPLTFKREHTRDSDTRDSDTRDIPASSQSSDTAPHPRPVLKRKTLPAAFLASRGIQVPEAPKEETLKEEAPKEEACPIFDIRLDEPAPEAPVPEAPVPEAPVPEAPVGPIGQTTPQKKRRREPKYPPGAMQAMTEAVTEACYPEGGVPASKGRIIGVKAAELLDAGYTPDDVFDITEFLQRDAWWKEKITPGALVSEAPRWKAAQAKRKPRAAAPQPKPEDVSPEVQAELDELAAHFANDPFADLT